MHLSYMWHTWVVRSHIRPWIPWWYHVDATYIVSIGLRHGNPVERWSLQGLRTCPGWRKIVKPSQRARVILWLENSACQPAGGIKIGWNLRLCLNIFWRNVLLKKTKYWCRKKSAISSNKIQTTLGTHFFSNSNGNEIITPTPLFWVFFFGLIYCFYSSDSFKS